MNDLFPYIGISLVVVIGVAAIYALLRSGLRLKRFKHNNTELEFEPISAYEANTTIDKDSYGIIFSKDNILISEIAVSDCSRLIIDTDMVLEFLISESIRHPQLFNSTFSSLPLIFGKYIMLISNTGSSISIERLLDRQDAYPTNDKWIDCLSMYRKLTVLPYRYSNVNTLYRSSESRRTLNVFRLALLAIKEYQDILILHNYSPPNIYMELLSILEEAEFLLSRGSIGESISRLEVILSSMHKFLLQYTPGDNDHSLAYNHIPNSFTDDRKKILLIEDLPITAQALGEILSDEGFNVTIEYNADNAIKRIVEQEYDIIITDVVMQGKLDAREVIIAATKSSNMTKIIIISAFNELTHLSNLLELGADVHIDKKEPIDRLLSEIYRLLNI